MSDRPPSRPRRRALVRTSQRSRSESQALQRAYELALPVVREPLAATTAAPGSNPVLSHRPVPQTSLGG
jgi:hypothetical protein